jgi:hypothetical protein
VSATPRPPYLVIREGRAFWVEARTNGKSSASFQAFEEGCFLDASAYDDTGCVWPIVKATLERRPSMLERLFGLRFLPVQLEFGAPVPVEMPELLSRLANVLRSENEFCEFLPNAPADVLRRFEAARSPNEIIRIAREQEEPV